MKIVAFGYRRGTGKDTLAKFIQRELLLKNRRMRVNVCGFADHLKDICYSLYSWAGLKPSSHYEANPMAKDVQIPGLPNGWKCPRDIWIAVGNHMRNLHEAVWRDALLKSSNCDVLIIKDMRFPVEVEAVKAQNGRVIRIDRPGTYAHDGAGDTVLMDMKDNDWTEIISNDGDLHKFHRHALRLAEELAS